MELNMGYSLLDTLEYLEKIDVREAGQFVFPNSFLTPGFWAIMAALGHKRGYRSSDICFANGDQQSYSRALGIEYALTGDLSDEPNRPSEGVTYSPIVRLNSSEETDRANSTINSCLRRFAPEDVQQLQGFRDLCHVIGEMHSNVWDHGLSPGFSIAQKIRVPYRTDDHFFEFALADCGSGFLKEMRRSGIKADSHQEAISWCIKEGNTTKSTEDRDEFAQTVPSDIAGGSPFGPQVPYTVGAAGNHHQGLGLAKLVKLVLESCGQLWLASGDAALYISPSGENVFKSLPYEWQGVALSCKLRSSRLLANGTDTGESLEPILSALRGA